MIGKVLRCICVKDSASFNGTVAAVGSEHVDVKDDTGMVWRFTSGMGWRLVNLKDGEIYFGDVDPKWKDMKPPSLVGGE